MFLVSCDGDSGGSADGDVTLTFAFWGAGEELEAKQAIYRLYMENNPGIIIEGTFTDGGEFPTRLQTWFAAGTAPDVMGIANDIIRPFLPLGVYEDLTPYMERDGLVPGETWLDIATDIFEFEGRIYAIPYVYKIPAIVFNKTLFDEAGVPHPTNDWTEADLFYKAQRLTTGEGRDKIYGFYQDWWPAIILRNLYGNPVYIAEENRMNAVGNEQFRAGVELFDSMINIYGFSTDATLAVTVEGGFETGRYAMAITAPWAMVPFDNLIGDRFDWDIVMLPINETHGRWRGNVFADGHTISIDSEHKDEAWEFIKWMSTDIEAQRMSDFGVPMLRAYAASQDYLDNHNTTTRYDRSVFVNMLEYATAWETRGVWGRVNDEMNALYEQFIRGEIDIDTLISEIQTRGQAIFDAGGD